MKRQREFLRRYYEKKKKKKIRMNAVTYLRFESLFDASNSSFANLTQSPYGTSASPFGTADSVTVWYFWVMVWYSWLCHRLVLWVTVWYSWFSHHLVHWFSHRFVLLGHRLVQLTQLPFRTSDSLFNTFNSLFSTFTSLVDACGLEWRLMEVSSAGHWTLGFGKMWIILWLAARLLATVVVYISGRYSCKGVW